MTYFDENIVGSVKMLIILKISKFNGSNVFKDFQNRPM